MLDTLYRNMPVRNTTYLCLDNYDDYDADDWSRLIDSRDDFWKER